jgi:hypothetical protein
MYLCFFELLFCDASSALLECWCVIIILGKNCFMPNLCKTQRGGIFDPGFCRKVGDFWMIFEEFLAVFGRSSVVNNDN